MDKVSIGEQKLLGMLRAAGQPKKASYNPSEVVAILGICPRTFWTMVGDYEPDPDSGQPLNPATLDSYMLRRSRRVRHDELAAYLERNNTYQRNNAIDPRQMALF
ncbi:helix-turn-helix domain-containing protein [Desulfuromonas acetoxidans]|uniref:Uncharacterized protein n=1 Tax=Desulfuromonas acetoxidans (strain DSM 684 / 11070) TaxID=281689 RepID=Q1K060_DESA6|nr:helix-turn-helix domain-containing protein [Desulfuromonas acetoxidans]EAT16081.1 hypothetical protein Dace_2382 [Desulfuromonas acetoxidans DSM 684]MBF0646897.1 helix-turn-helix domain-containing protein [Desulfuromonas acetoxidans]NVD26174.1 helix-turn-helix domain-containing protein [Desulfuromonas acetoxidans]NVE18014.1 helix-turn-helix domain-containing protein [Desulfuromonas acetoxidans]